MDGTDFFRFLRDDLLPYCGPWPGPHSLLVIDGASAHKWYPGIRLLDELDIVYVLTPSHAPEYNAIEVTFNTFKRDVRTCGRGLTGDDFRDVVYHAIWRHWRHSLCGPMRDAGLLDACRPWRG